MATRELTKANDIFPSLFEDFFKPWADWFGTREFMGRTLTIPRVNIDEKKECYELSVAVPGLKSDDFRIDVYGNILTISCEKEETKEDKDSRQRSREYNYSSFSRSFTLPDDVMQDKVEAVYVDGVLKLTLPKKEEAKKTDQPRQINVK